MYEYNGTAGYNRNLYSQIEKTIFVLWPGFVGVLLAVPSPPSASGSRGGFPESRMQTRH